MSDPEGLEIARRQIAEELQQRTGFLDLGNLGLTEFPDEMWELTHLQELSLGLWYLDNDGELHSTVGQLKSNKLGGELGHLDCLLELRRLSLNDLEMVELSTLSGLTELQSLSFGSTPISDLAPLAGLAGLQSLDCNATSVSDLAPLARLAGLQLLDCGYTPIKDLSPLSRLLRLQSLSCRRTSVRDLSPVSDLSELQSLDCSETAVSDLSPLSGLSSLHSLNCSGTSVSDLSQISSLSKLKSLKCNQTSVRTLLPLSCLPSLELLYLNRTPVSDLSPVSSLSTLCSLDLSETSVTDLSSVARLLALRSLVCSRTQVSDLGPVSGLSELRRVRCDRTSVHDLSPISRLAKLESLDCSETVVGDLRPVSGLSNLRVLKINGTLVKDLSPLLRLSGLRNLHCSGTSVSDLSAVSVLSNLRTLQCSNTPVDDLSPTSSLDNLQVLTANGCSITTFPWQILSASSFRCLHLHKTRIPGIPAEVLSQRSRDNCRQRLLDHLNDLAAGPEPLPDVKVIVLGNGRIGKTQICRRLRGEDYDQAVDSTHGIVVTRAPLALPGQPDANLNLWDFGGQDLYHGTHALFLKSRAVFVVVWTPAAETRNEYEHGGMRFRNQPLPYWLDYVRHAAGNVSPLVLVQNQCDTPQDEALQPPVDPDLLSQFPYLQQVHYSAKENRKRASLDDALREAILHLRNCEGVATIGKGRLRVRQQLQQWLAEDAPRDRDRRQHRTLTQQQFRELCEKTGGISSPESLLEYLHNAGIVFYRRGLFHDAIVLDQSWALDALYTVFHRQQCYRHLEALGGRFSRSLLETLAWPEYSQQEQELFLSLMESCRICFKHRDADSRRQIDAEYVAPDLLPARSDVANELAGRWDDTASKLERAWRYEFLHPGLVRSIISSIGKRAGGCAVYWKYGVWFYDANTRAQAMIFQEMQDDRRGRIVLQTQGDRRRDLLEATTTWIAETITRYGDSSGTLEGEAMTEKSEPRSLAQPDDDTDEGEPEVPKIRITDPPRPADELRACVSYAWKEESSSDPTRAGKVSEFCKKLTAAGRQIVRDTTHVALGDKLPSFMRQIGHGDRVFVFLSDAYLKSPNCMYELLTIWQTSGDDEERFRQRTRVYTMPGTRIFSPSDRLNYAVYWKQEFDNFQQLIKANGVDLLGPTDLKNFRNMQQFALQVNEMLAQVASILLPRAFDQYIDRAIEELPRNA